MIIIANKHEPNVIKVERNLPGDDIEYNLTLVSKSTNKEVSFKVADMFFYWNFYSFEVDFQYMNDGEYELYLRNAKNDVVAHTMIQIGTYKPKEQTSYTNKTTYTTYEPSF